MGKVLLWIVIVFAILFVLRMLSVAKMRRDKQAEAKASSTNNTGGPMVRCAECGVYLPKADALPSPKGFRCGDPKCARESAGG